MRAQVQFLDAVLFTHEHKDHVAGLDDIRAFNYRKHVAIDLYGNKGACEVIRREFIMLLKKGDLVNQISPKWYYIFVIETLNASGYRKN